MTGDEVALDALWKGAVAGRKDSSDGLFEEQYFRVEGWLLLKTLSQLRPRRFRTGAPRDVQGFEEFVRLGQQGQAVGPFGGQRSIVPLSARVEVLHAAQSLS